MNTFRVKFKKKDVQLIGSACLSDFSFRDSFWRKYSNPPEELEYIEYGFPCFKKFLYTTPSDDVLNWYQTTILFSSFGNKFFLNEDKDLMYKFTLDSSYMEIICCVSLIRYIEEDYFTLKDFYKKYGSYPFSPDETLILYTLLYHYGSYHAIFQPNCAFMNSFSEKDKWNNLISFYLSNNNPSLRKIWEGGQAFPMTPSRAIEESPYYKRVGYFYNPKNLSGACKYLGIDYDKKSNCVRR